MKPIFIKRNDKVLEESFTVQLTRTAWFNKVYHSHNELELVYIVKSKGHKLVNGEISKFSRGDLILFGSQLPHSWLNAPDYFRNESELIAEAIIVHFNPDFLGSALKERRELAKVNELVDAARQGISFQGASKQIVPAQLQDLLVMRRGLDRLILLLKILERLSDESDRANLCAEVDKDSEDRRVKLVDEMIMNGFRGKLSAQAAASLINMNTNAFSRFFTKEKGMPFSAYVNTIRLGYAKALFNDHPDLGIVEVAKLSGFHNMSNFNVQFKNIEGRSPSDYIRALS